MLLWHGSTPGVYIEGNANVAATGDYVGRHILILSVYLARDIHFCWFYWPRRAHRSWMNSPSSLHTGGTCSVTLIRDRKYMSLSVRKRERSVLASKPFSRLISLSLMSHLQLSQLCSNCDIAGSGYCCGCTHFIATCVTTGQREESDSLSKISILHVTLITVS